MLCEQSLRLQIGPEKPRNSAVFRGWLCTWTGAGGSELLSNAGLSLRPFTSPIRYPLNFCQIVQRLSRSLTNAKFAISLGGRDTGSKRLMMPFQDVGRTGVGFTLSAKSKCPNIHRSSQLVQERLGVLQIGCLEALREPAIDRREELAAHSGNSGTTEHQLGDASAGRDHRLQRSRRAERPVCAEFRACCGGALKGRAETRTRLASDAELWRTKPLSAGPTPRLPVYCS
jgi:hypothetical protein